MCTELDKSAWTGWTAISNTQREYCGKDVCVVGRVIVERISVLSKNRRKLLQYVPGAGVETYALCVMVGHEYISAGAGNPACAKNE